MEHKHEHVRVAIVYKDFSTWCLGNNAGKSFIGLCVAALTNARVLNHSGITATVFPVRHNIDLVDSIREYDKEHKRHPLTHVVISAPWLNMWDLRHIVEGFPKIQFAVESHSNIGFLQADPSAIHRFREIIKLSKTHPNVRVGGNSSRLVEWMRIAYNADVALLPNLYPLSFVHRRSHFNWESGVLKIGAFGAVRPQKNFLTACAAAVAIHKLLDIPVEFHMSTGGEGDGGSVSRAITEMTEHLPGFKLVRHFWDHWEHFIQLIRKMDLLLQPSYTESFNMITADGLSQGIPSVVSTAVHWAPESWKSDSDDALDIARVGISQLFHYHEAVSEGIAALDRHNEYGVMHWRRYLHAEC